MRINLLHHWRGGSQPARIWEPGEYDSDALPPRLADYWLANGHAERLDEPAAAESEPEAIETPESEDVERASEPAAEIDFSTWNRDDLEAYAIQLGIDLKAIKGTGSRGNVIVPDLVLAIAEAQQ